MTNWTARELTFDFSFLSKNTKYTGEIYKDGMNANLYADQYSFEYLQLNSNSKITIPLSAGGGTVLKIYPE